MNSVSVSAVLAIALGLAQDLTAQGTLPPPPPLGTNPPVDTVPPPPLDQEPPPVDEPEVDEPAKRRHGKRIRVQCIRKATRHLEGKKKTHGLRFRKALGERENSRAHMKRIRDLIRSMKRRRRK